MKIINYNIHYEYLYNTSCITILNKVSVAKVGNSCQFFRFND